MSEFESNKKSFEIGEVINEAFEIYKKTALIGGLAFMFLMLILIVFAVMGIGFFTDIEKFPELMENFDPNKLSVNGTLIYVGIITLIGALTSPFIAGMLKMAQDADKDQEVTFSSLFYYVNNPQFIHIVFTTILVSLISVGINMGLKFVLPGFAGEALGFIVSYALSVLTFLAIPLVIFNHLNSVEAIKVSIDRVSKHFWVVLLLIVVASFVSAVGLIAFCFGLFFTIPFLYAVQYSIYKKLAD